MKQRIFLITLILFSSAQILLAGPGGKVAKVLFDSPWGKVIMVILIIVFFPLIVYSQVREFFGVKKTRKDLAAMSRLNRQFDWFTLKNRATDIFSRVHRAWSKENMDDASDWMTDWYWQNQQLVYLDKWKEQGLINHTDVREIIKMKPLFLQVNEYGENHEGSRVVMSILANMEDYLAKRETGQIVEGKRGYREIETLWTLVLHNGQWILENIEESKFALQYVKLKNQLALNMNPQASA